MNRFVSECLGLRIICGNLFKLLFLAVLGVDSAMAGTAFHFIDYNQKSNLLKMGLVTRTVKGNVLLKSGKRIEPLYGATLSGLFMLRVLVPCEKLRQGATIYWMTEDSTQQATVPRQNCANVTPIKIINKNGECWLLVDNGTIWRAATELSKLNKATIYQNVYAIFFTNRGSFVGGDVNRFSSKHLRCPSSKLAHDIPRDDAIRLFREMLEFNKEVMPPNG